MRKLHFLLLALLASAGVFAQAPNTANKPLSLGNRAADHFMIQLGSSNWTGTSDSVRNYINGFNRSANVYAMIDKPFKTNPRMSVGIGVGVGTSNIYFDKMEVRITSLKPILPFVRTDTGNHYKKYKVATAYLEVPVELRFMSRPQTPNKSFKIALGVKAGTLLSAHTKGKSLLNSAGTKLNNFIVKESSKSYFNGTRVSVTARAGYGIFSVFGAYSITGVFKDAVAPDTKLLQIGISISGL